MTSISFLTDFVRYIYFHYLSFAGEKAPACVMFWPVFKVVEVARWHTDFVPRKTLVVARLRQIEGRGDSNPK